MHLVDQTVPATSFDAVLQRRHHAVGPHRGFHPRPVAGFCTLCSPCGHWRCFLCLVAHVSPPPSCPAFPRRGFAVRASRGSSPLRYYAGSDSCRASPARQVSPLIRPAFRASRPPPRGAPERRFVSRLSASGGALSDPGFTSPWPAP